MIVVDTSALMAILLDEPMANACSDALNTGEALLISAGTLAEALIVSGRHRLDGDLKHLIDGLGFEVVPVTQASAQRVGHAYDRWGKGLDAASLNFGDCFAYEVAKERQCRLLFVGNDFSRTDIVSVL